MKVFSVYDKAVSAFLPPFYARARGEALRMFTDACNDANGQFAKHLSDFQLFELGEFDEGSGRFTGDGPQRLLDGLEIVQS